MKTLIFILIFLSQFLAPFLLANAQCTKKVHVCDTAMLQYVSDAFLKGGHHQLLLRIAEKADSPTKLNYSKSKYTGVYIGNQDFFAQIQYPEGLQFAELSFCGPTYAAEDLKEFVYKNKELKVLWIEGAVGYSDFSPLASLRVLRLMGDAVDPASFHFANNTSLRSLYLTLDTILQLPKQLLDQQNLEVFHDCLANEKTPVSAEQLRGHLNKLRVLILNVDWTGSNMDVLREKKDLYVIYLNSRFEQKDIPLLLENAPKLKYILLQGLSEEDKKSLETKHKGVVFFNAECKFRYPSSFALFPEDSVGELIWDCK